MEQHILTPHWVTLLIGGGLTLFKVVRGVSTMVTPYFEGSGRLYQWLANRTKPKKVGKEQGTRI